MRRNGRSGRKARLEHVRSLTRRIKPAIVRLTPLCASLLAMGIGMLPGHAQAQTIDLTTANPSRDIGSGTTTITGLTVANSVSGVITGTGTLNYTGGSAFLLGSDIGGQVQNLNMSGLSNFTYDNPLQIFSVGGRTNNGINTLATLTLSPTSVITASSFGVADVPNNSSSNVRNFGTVNLGQATTINADTINVGVGAKTQGTMALQAGGKLVLRGTDTTSPVANWNIGTGSNSSIMATVGAVNLGAGSLDAKVQNILIGQTAGGSQKASGTLTLGSGSLEASSIVLSRTGTGTGSVEGTLTIGSANVIVQTLTLGDRVSTAGTVDATVNLNNGGTLKAAAILPGAGTAARTFNWTAGTIGNYASGQNMTVSIPTIALFGAGPHVFDIQGSGAVASVSSLVSGADAPLTKTGDGILALSGGNTYDGGTTVNGGLINFASLQNLGDGSLTLNGGGLQWASGNTADVSARLNPLGAVGAFFDTNGNDVTLAGVMTGGALVKQGAGILTLTGTSTYSGDTRIDAGTLQLGANGAAGSIIGNVVVNATGTLAFNRSDALQFEGLIAGSGGVLQQGAGTTTFTNDNTYTGGTEIHAGTLQLGDGGDSGSLIGNVFVNNGAILSINRSNTVTLPGVISGGGQLTQAGTGTTILAKNNTYTGGTQIDAGTLQLGDGGNTGRLLGNVTNNGTLAFNRADTVAFSNIISGTGGVNQLGPGTLQLGGDQTYTGATQVSAGTLALLGSLQSNTVTVAPGATLSGTGVIHGDVINQGRVFPGSAVAGATDYASLTVQGNYVGQNGLLELNTFLGGDGSPSDRLVIDGGSASGNTSILVHNTSASSAETRGDGILVVSAIQGGTTTADAFNLPGEVRRGALDYRLFRGSLDGTQPHSWYLRNEFVVQPPEPEPEPEPVEPDPELPADPPPEELPPGRYPIIGPELATYAAVQPLARELGQRTLSTLHDRVGDSAPMATDHPGDHGPATWGRVFGATIDQSYRSFAAPASKGNLSGFQIGVDMWQGQSLSGHTDSFGGYMAYGRANVDVRGLVTNTDATGYVRQHTGSLSMQATSVGAYWTHHGPTGWYLDGVAQATTYRGSASTSFARLNLPGTGFIASLEFGYPIALPQLGASFVLEPQLQAIYQYVNVSPRNDGQGPVELGSTHGSTGRAGLRGKWQLTGHNGQLWTPYIGLDLLRDWGARATTQFGTSGGDFSAMPMVPQATRASLTGGLTAQWSPRLALYGAAGYEHELGNSDIARRRGFDAHLGLRYAW
jgi:outer membrane autotransporter protein